jgi:hypothetical protein
MIFTTRYWSFWTRVRKGFLGGFLIVSFIVLSNYINDSRGFEIVGLIIIGFGVIYMITSIINSWTFVDKVKITEDKLIVTGTNLNTRWEKEFFIKGSDIKIKSKGRGRAKVEYYLRLSSRNMSVDINRSFNWDYQSLLTIFNEFKRLKGERIIFDEKYFLDIMEKKINANVATEQKSPIEDYLD